jgi:hypothetical protein
VQSDEHGIESVSAEPSSPASGDVIDNIPDATSTTTSASMDTLPNPSSTLETVTTNEPLAPGIDIPSNTTTVTTPGASIQDSEMVNISDPAWMAEASQHLLAIGGQGQEWENLIRKWIAIERVLKYPAGSVRIFYFKVLVIWLMICVGPDQLALNKELP